MRSWGGTGAGASRGLKMSDDYQERASLASLASQDEHAHDNTSTWWNRMAVNLHKQQQQNHPQNQQRRRNYTPKYDFTFRDFPRSDGSPCLIFAETDQGPVVMRRDGATCRMN